jgi:hypothetical protein
VKSSLKKINLEELKDVTKSNAKVNASIDQFINKLSQAKDKMLEES